MNIEDALQVRSERGAHRGAAAVLAAARSELPDYGGIESFDSERSGGHSGGRRQRRILAAVALAAAAIVAVVIVVPDRDQGPRSIRVEAAPVVSGSPRDAAYYLPIGDTLEAHAASVYRSAGSQPLAVSLYGTMSGDGSRLVSGVALMVAEPDSGTVADGLVPDYLGPVDIGGREVQISDTDRQQLGLVVARWIDSSGKAVVVAGRGVDRGVVESLIPKVQVSNSLATLPVEELPDGFTALFSGDATTAWELVSSQVPLMVAFDSGNGESAFMINTVGSVAFDPLAMIWLKPDAALVTVGNSRMLQLGSELVWATANGDAVTLAGNGQSQAVLEDLASRIGPVSAEVWESATKDASDDHAGQGATATD